MNELSDAFKAAAKSLGYGDSEIYDGIVKSVDEDKGLVAVTLTELDLTIPDVKLSSISGNTDGVKIIPSAGSKVVFAKIEGEADYILIKTEKIDKVKIRIDNTEFEVDKDGYKIARNSFTLLELMSEFIGIVNDLKVTTPAGPSTTLLPDSVLSLEKLKNKFKELLK